MCFWTFSMNKFDSVFYTWAIVRTSNIKRNNCISTTTWSINTMLLVVQVVLARGQVATTVFLHPPTPIWSLNRLKIHFRSTLDTIMSAYLWPRRMDQWYVGVRTYCPISRRGFTFFIYFFFRTENAIFLDSSSDLRNCQQI